nr:MAG TPA: hypothetical protein [Caudoviricetes sp.]
MDADVAGLVAGEGERLVQVGAVDGHIVENQVVLCGGVNGALGNTGVHEHLAHAQEVLDVGHAEGGLGGDGGGSQVVGDVQGVDEVDGLNVVVLKQGLELAPGLGQSRLEPRAGGRAGTGAQEGEKVLADSLLHVLKHPLRGHTHGLVIAALDDGLGRGCLAPLFQGDLTVGHSLGGVLAQGDGITLGDSAILQGAGGLIGLQHGARLLGHLPGHAQGLGQLAQALGKHQGEVDLPHAGEVGLLNQLGICCHELSSFLKQFHVVSDGGTALHRISNLHDLLPGQLAAIVLGGRLGFQPLRGHSGDQLRKGPAHQSVQRGGILDLVAVQFQLIDGLSAAHHGNGEVVPGDALALVVGLDSRFLGRPGLLALVLGHQVGVFLFPALGLFLPAVVPGGFQVVQFLLDGGQLVSVGLVSLYLFFQAVHSVGVCFNDGVHLLVGEPHALQKFSGQCHIQSPFLRPRYFGGDCDIKTAVLRGVYQKEKRANHRVFLGSWLLLPFSAPNYAEVVYLIVFLTSMTTYPSPFRRISASLPRLMIASMAWMVLSSM